jgi:hypothetical protein
MTNMPKDKPLPKRLQPALKALEKDLLERAKLPSVEAGLNVAWLAETKAGETGQGFEPWRRARVTQIAVAWVLSVVFVRTLEDRGLIDPRFAGPDLRRLESARDREATFVQVAPFLGPREYLLAVFRELSRLPGAREVFDAAHNPVWVLAPSSEGARALLDFFQQVDGETGNLAFTFPGTETRFLGDLYQDLSEAVRKRYALLQTPDFVEKFILEQTLAPAISEFGLAEVTLIDPTCGSGHFLLGAFRDLLAAWQTKEPATPIEELARRALAQVYGVDINPYAVAIARFRLVLALLDAVGIKRLDKAPDLKLNVVVADSLLHRLESGKQQFLLTAQPGVSAASVSGFGHSMFHLDEPSDVKRVLTKRFHAVVGNPPYITEKDGVKRKRFIEMYRSAGGQFALAAPFTERFFELGVEGGFVGLINANSFTKRDFGEVLIQEVLPQLDLAKIVDTSGCYLPGHGTPTLLLFGRNRSPGTGQVTAVLGKRGEREVPAEPAAAPVWTEIVQHHGSLGFEGKCVSVEELTRDEARRHPWILTGGGARSRMQAMEAASQLKLNQVIDDIGYSVIIGQDEAFVRPAYVARDVPSIPVGVGDVIRDWAITSTEVVIRPFDQSSLEVVENEGVVRALWFARRILEERIVSGSTSMKRAGKKWYDLRRLSRSKHQTPLSIAFSFVATHNHFALDRGGRIFKQSAPIIKLHQSRSEEDHQALLGYLNSSTVGFWCRLIMFDKGAGGGAIKSGAAKFLNFLEYAGNLLQQLPVPKLEDLKTKLLNLVVAAEETVAKMAEHAADKVVATTLVTTPTLAALRDARTKSLAERRHLRAVLVSLQEEMDWRVYGLFGLPTVEAPSLEAVRVAVEPNHRPFEVRLAREVATDISASEWFRVHKREAPKDVGGPLADLYRKRLRLLDDAEHGKQLRLLETPETKRRWSPPDDHEAFSDAVRTWLLERIESTFREQNQPELRTARQLALELGRDPAVAAAHELLTEETGIDLVRLLSDLGDAEGVPFLAGYRYAETGMEKRASWEEAWRLQRIEDEDTKKLEAELKRLNLNKITVPDKYGKGDLLRHYWRLRGELDVPKERFVTVPGGNTDDDTTPLVGWAGWDHLQVAQAVSGLYQRRKTEDGWQRDRLMPLLAGLDERVPWLLQWHNEPAADFGGLKLGDFFRDFVAAEAHALGVAVGDLRKWTPPASAKKQTLDPDELYAALLRWTPELDEDSGDDEDAETPEGPSVEELSSEVGATKALVTKAIKVLLAEGRCEKLDGRPARYVATGDDA